MPNPLVPQGTLNRLRASVVWNQFPGLNVTPSYLGKEGISLNFQGEATTFIRTMTGAITSPEPYQEVEMEIQLLKTQSLAAQFKAQLELSSLLGDCTVRPDSSVLPPYQLSNCAINGVRQLKFNGEAGDWLVLIHGYYLINSALFDLSDGLSIGITAGLAL